MAESAEKGLEKDGWTHLENGSRNWISPEKFAQAKLPLRLIAPSMAPPASLDTKSRPRLAIFSQPPVRMFEHQERQGRSLFASSCLHVVD